MPAGIKNGVEVFRLHVRKFYRAMARAFCAGRVLLKSRHGRRLIFRQVALWIEWGLTAFRRGQRQINASVPEDEVRGREFFKPEPGLATRVAELIMRRQHQEYFHTFSPSLLGLDFIFCFAELCGCHNAAAFATDCFKSPYGVLHLYSYCCPRLSRMR